MRSYPEFVSFITEAANRDVVHDDLSKDHEHHDRGGGYSLYKPNTTTTVDDTVKRLATHGYKKLSHYRRGGPGSRIPAHVHIYERKANPYWSDTMSLDHTGGKVTWMHRSVQRGD